MHSNCNGFEGGVQVRNAGEERGLKGEPVRAGNLRKGAIAEEGPPRPTGFGEVAARYRGARHSRVGAADPVYFSRSRQLRLFSGGSFCISSRCHTSMWRFGPTAFGRVLSFASPWCWPREAQEREAGTFWRVEDLWLSPFGDVSHATNLRPALRCHLPKFYCSAGQWRLARGSIISTIVGGSI